MDALLLDLRYAVRTLVRARGFSIAVVVLFAIGIGASTAMFSMSNTLLFRQLPWGEPERIVVLQAWQQEKALPLSPPDFHSIRERSSSFEALAGLTFQPWTLLEGDTPEALRAMATTAGHSQVFDGEAPLLGRRYASGDGEADAVVVLSFGLWQRRFGSDPTIVSRRINLSGKPFTVIGVMPKGVGEEMGVDLWLLRDFKTDEKQRGVRWLVSFGRLKPGVSVEAADAEVRAIGEQLAAEFPDTNATIVPRVVAYSDWAVQESKPTAWMLFGAIVLLLAIACANVANLVLARASTRSGEIAVQAALGATRGRIVRQLLAESVLLAIAGAALGLFLAVWGLDLLVLGLAHLPHAYLARVDGHALVFTCVASLVTGVVSGLVPALRASRWNVHPALKEGAARATANRANLMRNALVVAEIALALVLLSGTGVLAKSFARLMNVERGFDARGVTMFFTALTSDRYPTAGERSAFAEAMLPKLAALPGVESAAAMSMPPVLGRASGYFEIEGRPPWPRGQEPVNSFQVASPGYAKTLGLRILEGRFIDETDGASSRRVVVINETMARRFFPGESPIGKRLRIDWGVEGDLEPTFSEIVGVYGDTRNRGLKSEPVPETLFPFAQRPSNGVTFAVRGSIAGSDLLALARSAMRDVDPLQPLEPLRYGRDRLSSFEEIVDRSIGTQRFQALLLGAFATVALLLAAIGIFGVVAYSVEQRRSEFCIRQALGAHPGHILRLAMLRGTRLVAIGVGIGLVVAFFAMRVLRSLVFEINPLDPWLIAGVTVLLALVATFASYVPARRATRVSPMLALRGD